MSEFKTIGLRLAIRHEGNFVNAYLSKEASMDGSVLLGSIMHGIVKQHPDIWDRWKEMMTDAMSRGIEALVGHAPEMIERAAPPHERAGRA